MLLSIKPNGDISCIYSDDLADLMEEGDAKVTRASHVEPNPAGGWGADMAPVNGPMLGPFKLRSEALSAEVAYLENTLFG